MNNLFDSNSGANVTTIVVVTTVAGQPSFEMSGRPTFREISVAVKTRYGKQVVSSDGVVAAMPHSFGARIVPTPAEFSETRVADPMQLALNFRRPGDRRFSAF